MPPTRNGDFMMNNIEKEVIHIENDLTNVKEDITILMAKVNTLEQRQKKLDNYGWFALGVISLFTMLAMGVDKFKDLMVKWIFP